MQLDRCTARKVVDLGALVLRFSRVDRITFHPDGKRPETDSDHTVMLGIIACAFAERYLPQLDLGRVAQYALAHDLIEAYAGDTPTIRIDDAGRLAKHLREQEAWRRIRGDFQTSLPWVPAVIAAYEAQVDAEARYVKALDKLMPKITHLLNGGVTFRDHGMTRDELIRRYAEQVTELMEYASDFPPLFELRAYLVGMVLDGLPQEAS